jgi:hypothetical protein
MNIYVDESGDLGWKFDEPYNRGGSSRFLTITFLLVPKNLSHLPKRIVKKTYSKRKRSSGKELKGTDLTIIEMKDFANRTVELLTRNPEIEILAITVNKENVQPHIRQDPNKLYNYMINLILLDRIKNKPKVTFIPDKRSIKVESGNSLVDYLQIKLWFDLNVHTTIQNCPEESDRCLNLQFTDWVSHIVWSRFEKHEFELFNIIKDKIKTSHLFF